MSLILYDFPFSGNAQKVRLALAELGLQFEHRPVPSTRPRPDWYLAINPSGGVPTIQDGDLIVAESNAILRYVATRDGEHSLYPAAPARRARIDWILDAWATAIQPLVRGLHVAVFVATMDEHHVPHPEEADDAHVQAALAQAREGWSLLERLCAEDASVCGGGFTIAECAIAPVLIRTRALPLDLDAEFPKLARIREALERRPSVGVIRAPA
jgi:glutathione S-transferase